MRAIFLGIVLGCSGGLFAMEQDVTPYGTPVAAVSRPTGTGNHDIEVIRDGVMPAVRVGIDSGSSFQQYDTWDGANFSWQDWIGYEFPGKVVFTKLVFQEGKHFFDGGYFDPPGSLVVQVEVSDGVWEAIEGSWDPPYTGLSSGGQVRCFETFTWTIDPPSAGTGIRIWGQPGGAADFTSVAELRVSANLAGEPPQAAFTVTPAAGPRPLAVTFDASSSSGGNLTYDWDLGDGSSGSGVNMSHTYTELGTYQVTLTVTSELFPGFTLQSMARRQVVVGLRASDIGTPVARVMFPTGQGNLDIESIRDGVRPEIAYGEDVGDSHQQYDTWDGANFAAEDWIGYEFPCTVSIDKVVFQEGKHLFDGGYFDPPESLVLQYRDPDTRQWLLAEGGWNPPYQGRFTNFQIVEFETFTWEISGGLEVAGIRIWGQPGGSAYFISVAELEVFVDTDDLLPVASFTATPTQGTAPLAVSFDASASIGKNLSFQWDFGDGESSSGVTASHTCQGAGNFTVTLTVSTTIGDGCEVTDSATASIRTAFNLAPLGAIIARVPNPLGGGNWDPEVIRDGDRPDVTVGENVGDSLLQFDTWDGASFADEDWIGYRFGCNYLISQVVFQEGKHFFDGGYFAPPESLTVQLHDPADDSWFDAAGEWIPTYQGQVTDGEIRNFETFVWNIQPPASGDGVRIHGTPGGTAAFISVAELEVCASGDSGSVPQAVADADDLIGAVPFTVNFDGRESTAPSGSTYAWDFGDGGAGAGPTASHAYATAGSYTATLTVTAPGGLCAKSSLHIVVHPTEFTTTSGFVRSWLILGPYAQAGGPNPLPATMELDYLTDGGAVTESDILPRGGMQVETSYGVAASTGLAPTSRTDINPDGVPTWFTWEDDDDTIDFEQLFQTIPVENLMVYACVYVTNTGAAPLVCNIGCASDDSIQVILDDISVHTSSVERDLGNPEEVVDVVSDVTLPPGRQARLLVKVFQGTGGAGLRLRFQAADGTPIAEPAVTFSLEPDVTPPIIFKRGDANADGILNMSDAIYVLRFLFLDARAPSCREAANSNDDTGVNISDPIHILNFLFLGGPPPPAPGPASCGPDPAASPNQLGCETYLKC